jgi:hypothetical protein
MKLLNYTLKILTFCCFTITYLFSLEVLTDNITVFKYILPNYIAVLTIFTIIIVSLSNILSDIWTKINLLTQTKYPDGWYKNKKHPHKWFGYIKDGKCIVEIINSYGNLWSCYNRLNHKPTNDNIPVDHFDEVRSALEYVALQKGYKIGRCVMQNNGNKQIIEHNRLDLITSRIIMMGGVLVMRDGEWIPLEPIKEYTDPSISKDLGMWKK